MSSHQHGNANASNPQMNMSRNARHNYVSAAPAKGEFVKYEVRYSITERDEKPTGTMPTYIQYEVLLKSTWYCR
jgi:hypothetical protein